MQTETIRQSTARQRPPFGQQLREYRRIRGMSQLDLATASGVSPRHVSFVESGRAKPSRQMVLKLSATLDMPLRAQNDLLHLAGFSPAYPERRLDAPELAGIVSIIDRMLVQQEPYPAFVIDRYWDVVKANDTANRLFANFLPTQPFSAVDLFLGPGVFRDIVENWEELSWVTLHRLRREATQAGNDAKLDALLVKAEDYMRDVPSPKNIDTSSPTVMCRLRMGDRVVSTISTIASFSAARDVTLDELHVELVYPADDEAEAFFREAAAAG